jgi:hypothetical protein
MYVLEMCLKVQFDHSSMVDFDPLIWKLGSFMTVDGWKTSSSLAIKKLTFTSYTSRVSAPSATCT